MSPPKCVLAVIDGLTPSELERAVAAGRAPVLAMLMERGTYVDACAAAFPSVTPVCAASITTGVLQDVHHIPAMNWYSRAEGRYVEYGSSFSASRRFGFAQQLTDTVYNLNAEHLDADTPTVFERLDDAGWRTAGTTYLVYRGRHQHEPSDEYPLTRLVGSTLFRRTVEGPRELFYADLYASRRTGCWSQMGSPGMRDQHGGCVGAHLVEHDLFDFLLLSLPDNDTASHRGGLQAQVEAIEAADRQLERVMHAGGGREAFLADHAVVVMADHAHAPVEHAIGLGEALEGWAVRGPGRGGARDAEVALCPSQRAAMLYALVEEGRESSVPPLVAAARGLEGVDVVLWREDSRGVLGTPRGELRFAPGRPGERVAVDPRGGRWSLEGNLDAIEGRIEGGELRSDAYPDALARAWAALRCPTSGDVLLSAAPGWEFPDWGGHWHQGGGSHGSLHACDSLGALIVAGLDLPPERVRDGAWSIRDVAPLIAAHFGVA
ncbi:MAG TPA: alkaline phosphatase family protein [Solirubrobacteraceae bacterium]|nr:alkaline phosphatase family protein [Solirubrobacteraceae bacterium]